MTLVASYNALFANDRKNDVAFFGDGYFRGHLFQAVAKYRFNQHLSGHLWAEYLIPGDYYNDNNNDDAVFLRVELNLTL